MKYIFFTSLDEIMSYSFQKFEYPLYMFDYRNKCLSLPMYIWRCCFRDFQVKTHVQTAHKVYYLNIDLCLFFSSCQYMYL